MVQVTVPNSATDATHRRYSGKEQLGQLHINCRMAARTLEAEKCSFNSLVARVEKGKIRFGWFESGNATERKSHRPARSLCFAARRLVADGEHSCTNPNSKGEEMASS